MLRMMLFTNPSLTGQLQATISVEALILFKYGLTVEALILFKYGLNLFTWGKDLNTVHKNV